MSRFPLTHTPAQAAMLARCLFGAGSAMARDPEPDDGHLVTTGRMPDSADDTPLRHHSDSTTPSEQLGEWGSEP
jgi:hypothetical protein